MLIPKSFPYKHQVRLSSYYDAVIVGGGMVGNALACALGSSPSLAKRKVLVLEGGQPKGLARKAPSTYSNRVSAVSPASIDLFKSFDIWKQLENYGVKKVSRLHVLDSCSTAEVSFDQPERNKEIAYIIENDAIVGALFEKLQTLSSVEVRTGASVKNCRLPNEKDSHELATVELADGKTIETSLIIGADGFKSRVREAMNVEYSGWSYEQAGLVATLNLEGAGNDIAWQRFSKLGPIALLPLSDTVSSLVWTTTPEEAKRLIALSPDSFIDELNHALFTEEDQNAVVNQTLFLLSRACPSSWENSRGVPPQIISLQSDTRAAFPLGFGHAKSYVTTRAALVGDAAHRVHPLAGQGVNLGWSDVTILAKILERAHNEGADWGLLNYLSEYDTIAQRHNVPVMVSIDWLNRLYRTDSTPLVMLRSLGLAGFNKLTPLKDLLVKQLSTQRV
ncbi:unnamed protein product [Auanema sp. JU1783]|nr:unnamed protein product [Auanema sp. JU1783]